MSVVNFSLLTSIDETKQLIKSIGATNTVVVVSEPGVGKSAILGMLKEGMGEDNYDYIYVDCPVKDMMDIAASIPNHESKTLEYYVSSLFKLGNGKKKVIMLDEFMKAPKLMQIIYTRLMLERCVGDVPLPEGSIVFATSNNTSDGVGDGMLAHVGNRVCLVNMRKPTHDEWNVWAGAHGVARAIRAWAAMNTRAFKSYLDADQQDNPYIFKPSSTAKSFVSPRSLAKCSTIVENRDKFTENALVVALAGTAGEAFAKSIAAYIALDTQLTKFEDVIRAPKTVSVPDNVSALVMMMFEAVDKLNTQDSLDKYMEFVNRIPQEEIQSIFFMMMMRSRPRLARYNASIVEWATANHQLL